MARKYVLTDDESLHLLDSSDEEESDQEDVDFEQDLTENMSASSSTHELSSFEEEEMEVDNRDDNVTANACDVSNNAESDADSDNSLVASISCTSSSAWKQYTPTDRDLLKISFTVNSPGIKLPASGQYDNELSFFQLFFSDECMTDFVQETYRYAKEKIQKTQPLPNRFIWKNWKDTTLEEMKAFLGVVLNMGLHGKSDLKEYFSRA